MNSRFDEFTYYQLRFFCEVNDRNICSHLCFVYHYVARNVDMLEKTKQNRLLILSFSVLTIVLVFVSNNVMIRKETLNTHYLFTIMNHERISTF